MGQLGAAIGSLKKLYYQWSEGRKVERALRRPGAVPQGSFEIAVYFADPSVNLYQLRQWYAPLSALAERHRVVLISRSPGAMLQLMRESPLPVVYLRKVVDFERFLGERGVRVMLYVNQNTKNFQGLRTSDLAHVMIGHGESDKEYMRTNQYKAYDFTFVAGDAARDRLANTLRWFDVERRALPIGRPQVDFFDSAAPFPSDGRTVVLYAPTWEGDRGATAYSSVLSHGEQLAAALLASDRHRLVYRPHPRTGATDPRYRRANERIIDAISRANAADPSAHHVFDDSPSIGWQLLSADLAVTDISAMVYDRLATGRPILVAKPADASAEVRDDGYLQACEWLSSDQASDIVSVVDDMLADEGANARLKYWVERYFGDTTPGAATSRFLAAIERVLDELEASDATRRADTHAAGSREADTRGTDAPTR